MPTPTQPKISLCIATINRAHVIGETLDSIVGQLTAWWEVVIVDSSETDATGKLVEAMRARFPALTYERRPSKGVDRNYEDAVRLSRGEYCWLFPDDDLLHPGALAAVLAAVERGPDCVIVNAEIRDARLRTVISPRRLSLEADRDFEPEQFDAFAATVLTENYLSYLGGLVIRRRAWDERDRARYFGSCFIHVGTVIQKRFAGRMIVLAHPWISIRYGVGSWLERALEIWFIKWPEVIWNTEALSEATKRVATAREPWHDLRSLVLYRAFHWLTWTTYRRFLHDRPMPWKVRLCIWILCTLPFPLANRMTAWISRHRWKQTTGLEPYDIAIAFDAWRQGRNPGRRLAKN